MKAFDEIAFGFAQCRKEVGELADLLSGRDELAESADVLPFFQAQAHLSALCGKVYNASMAAPDRIAYEFDLFGDFAADLVVGTWRRAYTFVEFEDAKRNSVFRKKGSKATPVWSDRFEQGYSQIVDWFYKLENMKQTTDYEARFGSRDVKYQGLLVIGRDAHLGLMERDRLAWRSDGMALRGHKIHCVTFDRLLADMQGHLRDMQRMFVGA